MRVVLSVGQFRRVACWLGFHRYEMLQRSLHGLMRRCRYCGRRQLWDPYEEIYNDRAARGRWEDV